jgi:hypothetical protein
VRIEDGAAESHPTPLAIDASHSPGVVGATPAFASGTAQGGVRDLTGERLSQLAASEAECAAAQAFGQSADGGRRAGYAADISPLGASYGDAMALPEVTSDYSKHTGSAGSPDAGPAG